MLDRSALIADTAREFRLEEPQAERILESFALDVLCTQDLTYREVIEAVRPLVPPPRTPKPAPLPKQDLNEQVAAVAKDMLADGWVVVSAQDITVKLKGATKAGVAHALRLAGYKPCNDGKPVRGHLGLVRLWALTPAMERATIDELRSAYLKCSGGEP